MNLTAIISDVHANLEAFEAVLDEIKKLRVKDIYSLGDIIGYGPDPVKCTKLAMKHCKLRLMGNHEYEVRNVGSLKFNPTAQKAADWTREQVLSAGLLDAATDLPEYHLDDGILYVHGSVNDPITDYVHETDTQGFSNFDDITETLERDFQSFRLCFVGHNHQPFLATSEGFLHPHDDINEFYVGDQNLYVSVGSVGQPRDKDPRACFVTFDGEVVKYHRVNYPHEITAEKIYNTPLPDIQGQRLQWGK